MNASDAPVGRDGLDGLDHRILSALQQDGDLTQAELADRVGSTPSTCLRRVQRLKATGYLTGRVYLASPKKLGRGLKAFILVVTKGHGGASLPELATRVQQEPAIGLAYGASGETDVILVGNFIDMEEYRETCRRLLDTDPKVERYSAYFVIETFKEQTSIPTDPPPA